MKRLYTLAFASLAAMSSTSIALAAPVPAEKASAHPAAARLLGLYSDLAPRLKQNQFGRPLVLQSRETPRHVSGDVYAEIDTPFDTVRKTFANPRAWCDVLILHLNTKYCRAGVAVDANRLSVRMGKKSPQDINEAFALDFAFRLDANRADYLAALLTAPNGPLGTEDYQFDVQAIPLGDGKTFLRLHYSYALGGVARVATQAYLATGGRGKVGFTPVGAGAGKQRYIGGMRGVAERNTMRYYLAVESYLDSLALPPARQFSSRIAHWFDATEQYRLQLHEMDRSDYLSMKRREYERQQTVVVR